MFPRLPRCPLTWQWQTWCSCTRQKRGLGITARTDIHKACKTFVIHRSGLLRFFILAAKEISLDHSIPFHSERNTGCDPLNWLEKHCRVLYWVGLAWNKTRLQHILDAKSEPVCLVPCRSCVSNVTFEMAAGLTESTRGPAITWLGRLKSIPATSKDFFIQWWASRGNGSKHIKLSPELPELGAVESQRFFLHLGDFV